MSRLSIVLKIDMSDDKMTNIYVPCYLSDSLLTDRQDRRKTIVSSILHLTFLSLFFPSIPRSHSFVFVRPSFCLTVSVPIAFSLKIKVKIYCSVGSLNDQWVLHSK